LVVRSWVARNPAVPRWLLEEMLVGERDEGLKAFLRFLLDG
jgi:hypothetical protein